MDKFQSCTNLIKLIYASREDSGLMPELVKEVCLFFDNMKGQELSDADLRFMHFLAVEAGIPQYYYMLGLFQMGFEKRGYDVDLELVQLLTKESTLYTSEETYLHLYQKQILRLFKRGERNRYFLSASTSFGKTHLVYEIMRKMDYGNAMLVFPTIALLSENIQRIYLLKEYQWIKDKYKIHTLSDTDGLGNGNNLFIYTPERYLSFLDNNPIPQEFISFVFIDEAYKLDNEYLDEGERKENERDVAYRIAIDYALSHDKTDCLFAGPYIAFDRKERVDYNPSFDLFLNAKGITLLNYNSIEIVQKNEFEAFKPTAIEANDLKIEATEKNKIPRFTQTVSRIIESGENVIVYNSRRRDVEGYTKKLIESGVISQISTEPFQNLYDHLCGLFVNGAGAEWVVTKALRYGIGVHHGLVPKYIQNEIISLFNNKILKVLICTTTITEGINTNAKNVIVLSGNKGSSPLKKFDAKNIEGRAGRFMNHYAGRVIIMAKEFKDVLEGEDDFIKHKFFDSSVDKEDVDLPFVSDAYLTDKDRTRKEEMENDANAINLPIAIRNSNKSISLADKVKLYGIVYSMSLSEKNKIKNFIRNLRFGSFLEEGFDVICQKVLPIVHNNDMKEKADKKVYNGISLLTVLVRHFYLNGLLGSINYYLRNDKGVDEAVRTSTQFVYNTLRYQVVKYLGLFNLIYKEYICKTEGKDIESVAGIDSLLVKFEYNAETLLGRRVSDMGAALKVVRYFDMIRDQDARERVFRSMDAYEIENKESIERIIFGE